MGAEFVQLSLVPMLIGALAAVACALPGNFLTRRFFQLSPSRRGSQLGRGNVHKCVFGAADARHAAKKADRHCV